MSVERYQVLQALDDQAVRRMQTIARTWLRRRQWLKNSTCCCCLLVAARASFWVGTGCIRTHMALP
jgi:5'-deoxynucleotidase YfbR-like HD superfamily hydrolase